MRDPIMENHVTHDSMIRLALGLLPERGRIEAMRHIGTCRKCSRELEMVRGLSAPSRGKIPRPDAKILDRVLASYDRASAAQKIAAPGRSWSLMIPQFRYAAGTVSLLAACVTMFFLYSHFQFENAPMQASQVKGHVRVDKTKIITGQSLKPGAIVTTGENSRLAIIYGKIVKLIAGPDTRINITKSHIDRKTGKVFFEMEVDRGVIIAVFDKSGNLEYTLKTPHGKVNSTGSRIALKVDSSKTRVVVKNGSANLTSRQGNSVNSEEGNGYSITNKEVTSAMESSDDDEDGGTTLYDNTVRDLLDEGDDDVVIQ